MMVKRKVIASTCSSRWWRRGSGSIIQWIFQTQEALRYRMDQNGLQPRDLIPFNGNRNRVHKVLNRRHLLTLKMIR
jgi:hypothetical protein